MESSCLSTNQATWFHLFFCVLWGKLFIIERSVLMKIAVMGPKEFAMWVKTIIKNEYHDASIELFCYDRYIEVIEFLKENQNRFDGIMFPGHVSYMYAERLIGKETLWQYIPINTGSFYRALLETDVRGNDINSISIETYKKEIHRGGL